MLTSNDVTKGSHTEDFTGKVLVLKHDRLAPPYQKPEFQLWRATGGFGCKPGLTGTAVFAECLADGEKDRWSRHDFHGIATDEAIARFQEANV